jgi:hypothetical protein
MSDPNDSHRPLSQDNRNPIRHRPPALMAGIQVVCNWWDQSRVGRIMLTGVLAIIAGTIVITPTLSYNGICFSQGRFLSDEEYENIAISQIMGLRCYQLMSPIAQCVPSIRYKDVADFRARNRDCCKFVRHNSDFAGSGIVTFSQQLFGYAARSVLVDFKITYVDGDGHPQDTISHGLVVVANCGTILNRGH